MSFLNIYLCDFGAGSPFSLRVPALPPPNKKKNYTLLSRLFTPALAKKRKDQSVHFFLYPIKDYKYKLE
jgi:hypothetical protein